jgi:hypothetical protein
MKRKNLIKKIRSLEARLAKGAKKLTKLKSKLATREKTAKGKKKTARPRSTRAVSEKKDSAKPARATKRAAKKKRKLNLSPERRAQLAAAMKARWAAKRATDASMLTPVPGQDYSLGQNPAGL